MRRPTEIVQLLDSDEQIELAMNKWLKILSEHIRVDTADIFQLHSDTDTMNVVCEWRAPGQISYFDKINGVEVYSFLYAEKPLVVSTDRPGQCRLEGNRGDRHEGRDDLPDPEAGEPEIWCCL